MLFVKESLYFKILKKLPSFMSINNSFIKNFLFFFFIKFYFIITDILSI